MAKGNLFFMNVDKDIKFIKEVQLKNCKKKLLVFQINQKRKGKHNEK